MQIPLVTISFEEYTTLRKCRDAIIFNQQYFVYIQRNGDKAGLYFATNDEAIKELGSKNQKLNAENIRLAKEIKRLHNKKWWEK